jgi:hypothetical protein
MTCFRSRRRLKRMVTLRRLYIIDRICNYLNIVHRTSKPCIFPKRSGETAKSYAAGALQALVQRACRGTSRGATAWRRYGLGKPAEHRCWCLALSTMRPQSNQEKLFFVSAMIDAENSMKEIMWMPNWCSLRGKRHGVSLLYRHRRLAPHASILRGSWCIQQTLGSPVHG